jgi:hypothetical protein
MISPKRITRFAILVGTGSVIGGILMLLWQPPIGLLNWWPVGGLLLSTGLIGFALLKGIMMTVEDRVAMNDAMNRCYLGEQDRAE